MQNYLEQLKDPRWQRLRLRVMERENFACEECHSSEKSLNVHHCFYLPDKAPWEYPLYTFRCLCEDCHKAVKEKIDAIKGIAGGLRLDQLAELEGYIERLFSQRHEAPASKVESVQ